MLVFTLGGEFLLLHGPIWLKPASVLGFALAIGLIFLEALAQVLQAYIFALLSAHFTGCALAEQHYSSAVWAERLVPGEPEIFVACQEGNADRTLLAIHGGPDWDHSYLRDPLERLDCRLLMPDLRGCGRSGRVSEEQYHPDAMMQDLLRVLDAFGVERADVLGHSYGGMVAQRFAITHPSRVRSLIVSGSSVLPVPPDAFAGWTEREEILARQENPWQREDLSPQECVRAEAFAAAPANIRRAEAMPGYLRRLGEVRFSAEYLRPYLAGSLVSPRLPDAAQRIAELGIPVLLLHGRQDMTFPADLVEPTLKLIPRARAVVLEEAGHMVHVDEPDGYLDAVREFLAEQH